MTTKTTPYLAVTFLLENGNTGLIWVSKMEAVWGDEDRDEFAGFIFTEYQTGKIWKVGFFKVMEIKKQFMMIELA